MNHWGKISNILLTSLLMLKIWNFTVSRQIYSAPVASVPPFFWLTLTKTVQLRWVCMTWSTLLHVVTVSVANASLSSQCGAVSWGLSAVVGDHCSVLVDALWLCTALALLQPVLTCVAAYCLKGDVYTTVTYFIESYKLLQKRPDLVYIDQSLWQITKETGSWFSISLPLICYYFLMHTVLYCAHSPSVRSDWESQRAVKWS